MVTSFRYNVERTQQVAIRSGSVTVSNILAIVGVGVFIEVVTIIRRPRDKREVTTQPLIDSVPGRERTSLIGLREKHHFGLATVELSVDHN